jgi:hypothetical protein
MEQSLSPLRSALLPALLHLSSPNRFVQSLYPRPVAIFSQLGIAFPSVRHARQIILF